MSKDNLRTKNLFIDKISKFSSSDTLLFVFKQVKIFVVVNDTVYRRRSQITPAVENIRSTELVVAGNANSCRADSIQTYMHAAT